MAVQSERGTVKATGAGASEDSGGDAGERNCAQAARWPAHAAAAQAGEQKRAFRQLAQTSGVDAPQKAHTARSELGDDMTKNATGGQRKMSELVQATRAYSLAPFLLARRVEDSRAESRPRRDAPSAFLPTDPPPETASAPRVATGDGDFSGARRFRLPRQRRIFNGVRRQRRAPGRRRGARARRRCPAPLPWRTTPPRR